MGRSPRTIKLVEALRTILRAVYPGRPALADEIQSYGWDHFGDVRWWFVTHLTSDEVIAVNKAFEVLNQGTIRLRGVLGPSCPEQDIDTADVRDGRLHVFDGKLYFLENKVIKTYHRVRAYETDLDRCVAELRSETKQNRVPLSKPTSETDLQNFTTNYSGQRTLGAFTAAAEAEGINATRKRLNAALDTLGPRRVGAPTGPRLRAPQPKSAGK
jgi:hypothetical protein